MTSTLNKVAFIITNLNNLVHNRYNNTTLEARLTEIFGQPIKVEDISKPDDELTDYNLLFEFNDESKELFGYVDIYYLPMRKEGFDGSNMIITEVAYQFE